MMPIGCIWRITTGTQVIVRVGGASRARLKAMRKKQPLKRAYIENSCESAVAKLKSAVGLVNRWATAGTVCLDWGEVDPVLP